jgi:hypothetical protein
LYIGQVDASDSDGADGSIEAADTVENDFYTCRADYVFGVCFSVEFSLDPSTVQK